MAATHKQERMAEMEKILDFVQRTRGDMDPALRAQLDGISDFLILNPPKMEDFKHIKTIVREATTDGFARAMIDYADSFSDDATGFKSSGLSFAEKAAPLMKQNFTKPKHTP